MNSVWVVLVKELRDLIRDRRTLLIGLLMGPVLFPALIVGLGTMAAKKATTQMEKTLELAIVGAEHAPNLVTWLEGQNIRAKASPADPEAAILAQDEEVILRIPPAFGEEWRANRPAVVELLHDATRQDSQIPVNRVAGLLEQYSRQLGMLRLLARGVDPGIGSALRVSKQDLSSPEARSGMVLSMMLPYLLILMAFLGGAYLVIDATAGERERQSLEPLLATPAARGAIISGKIAAACVFGLASLVLTLIGFKVGVLLMPTGGLKMEIGLVTMLQLLAVLLPMLLIGTALLTLISASVKSVKEAQSYMSVLMLLPLVPSIVLMVNPVKTQLWMYAVPFLAQNQMITKLVRQEPLGATEWGIYLAAGVGLGVLLWLIAARLYHRENLAISA
jgi:sodium transport system permease protein